MCFPFTELAPENADQSYRVTDLSHHAPVRGKKRPCAIVSTYEGSHCYDLDRDIYDKIFLPQFELLRQAHED